MKKISCVLATLATIAIASPVVGQDKPMLKEGTGDEPVVHHHMHVHHHYHHHVMIKKPMMDKGM
jgi:hypothetical protein